MERDRARIDDYATYELANNAVLEHTAGHMCLMFPAILWFPEHAGHHNIAKRLIYGFTVNRSELTHNLAGANP